MPRNKIILFLSKTVPLVFLFSVFFGGTVEARRVIAGEGRAGAVVIAGDEASAVERHAADELCHFLEKATGASFEKSGGPVPGKYSIWLGTPRTNPGIEKAGVLEEVEGLSGHGFLLFSGDEGLVIAGSEPLGVLYGVYGFLEEHVGFRWYFPGEHGEYTPDIPDFSVGKIDEVQEPSFQRRSVALSRVGGQQSLVDTWDWAVRNRLQLRFHPGQADEYEKRGAEVTGGGHILHRMVPDELFDEHPEYFGLYDGERRKQRGHRGQPCTTHPDVIELASRYMIEWFGKNPGGIFTLNNNDYRHFCECDNCVSLDPAGEREKNLVATRFFIFKNEVARRVWEKYPDAAINTLAYQDFRQPPTGVVPDSRLWVTLCDHWRCYRHSLDDPHCAENQWFREMFEGWAEFGNPRGYFQYYNMVFQYDHAGMPEERIIALPLESVVEADMRYMHRLGHSGWSIRVRPPDGDYAERFDNPRTKQEWRANLHWIYMQAKLAWDIEQDADEILEDLYCRFYGPAGEAMASFRKLLLNLWERAGHLPESARFTDMGRMVDGHLDRLASLLEEAASAVEKTSVYAERVAEEKRIFENSWMLAHSCLPGEGGN